MSTSIIQLKGSQIGEIRRAANTIAIILNPAYIIRSLSGSQDTKWRQKGELELRDVELAGELPNEPCVISGGRIQVNQFTYMDMFPIPLESPGHIRLQLQTTQPSSQFEIMAEYVKLTLEGTAKYIEHLT